MRDILNLQALKHSKKRKDKAIWEKAHRIMQEKFETPEVSDQEIMEIAKDFPTLTVKVLIGGDISIRSFKDTWMIIDEGRFYTLYHSGLEKDRGNRGRYKERYHLQDVFMDLNYIFASLVTHDDFKTGVARRNPLGLLEMVQ